MPSVTFYPHDHGLASRTASGEAWSTIRTSAGTGVDKAGTVNLTASANISSGWDYMSRYLMVFDTSSLPDTAVVSAVTLTIWLSSYSVDSSGGLIVHSASAGGTVTSSDYTVYSGSVSARKTSFFTGTGAGDGNSFSLSTGSVSLLGVSGFNLLTYNDSANTEPSLSGGTFSLPYGNYSIYSGSYGTVGIRPQLTVTYTVPPTVANSSPVTATAVAATPAANTRETATPNAAVATTTITDSTIVGLDFEPVTATSGLFTPTAFLSGVLTVNPDPAVAVSLALAPQANSLTIFDHPMYTVPNKLVATEGGSGSIPVSMSMRQAGDRPMDLSAISDVKVYIWDENGTYVANGTSATVVNAPSGSIRFDLPVGSMTHGLYNMELSVLMGDGSEEIVPSSGFVTILVRDSFA